jgi:hypothetical protein
VDLNRNWGFGFYTEDAITQHNLDPCNESFQGPYPFSEPETRAARDFIMDHINQIKFVENFHQYGNTMLEHFNSLKGDILQELFPEAKAFIRELVDEGDAPEGMIVGTAYSTLNYTSPGEMSDWITAATGIPSVSPELGTSDPATDTFFIEDLDVIIDVLNQNWPLV